MLTVFGSHTSNYIQTSIPNTDCLTVDQSRDKFNRIMGGIPENRRHLLYIDKSRWKQVAPVPKVDPFIFDNEPGYHNAMQKVLNFIGNHLGQKLNALKLRDLHDLCVDNVFRDPSKKEPFLKGYRDGWGYEFCIKDVPQATLDELHQEKVLIVPRVNQTLGQEILLYHIQIELLFLSTYVFEDEMGKIVSNFMEQEQEKAVHAKIDQLFNDYYQSIFSLSTSSHVCTNSPETTSDKKLVAIAKLCRAINMFHVFPDGNGRTVLWAMLPKLLMENDFCPAILERPSRFASGYQSINEMVEQLKIGMKNFERVVEQFKNKDAS